MFKSRKITHKDKYKPDFLDNSICLLLIYDQNVNTFVWLTSS